MQTVYPQYIVDCADQFKGRSVFYFLELPLRDNVPIYKFGISTQCDIRIRTHYRKLNVIRVVKIIDCVYDTVMQQVETEFKRYAKSIGIMITALDNTEILATPDINQYVNHVQNMINTELLKPQKDNVRNVIVENIKIPRLVRDTKPEDHCCCNCGKVFRAPAELERHKNRKTPCRIRDIKPEDIKNPNRCIYCNKIFSTSFNLKKHHGKCKVKKEGVRTPRENVNYEEMMRIMMEEHLQELKDLSVVMSAKIDSQEKIINELRTAILTNGNNVRQNTSGDHNIVGDNNAVKN